MELKILHMYPDLLNLYGDRGNIIVLERRARWRGIKVEVLNFTRDKEEDIEKADIIFLGGGSDREQELLFSHIIKFRDILKDLIKENIVFLAICGGYQLLGEYYLDAYGNKIEGLSILNFCQLTLLISRLSQASLQLSECAVSECHRRQDLLHGHI